MGGSLVDDPTYFSYGFSGDYEPSPAFAAHSVEGNLTLSYNQTAPDGTTGCLKGVYDTAQTNNSGIIITSPLDVSRLTVGDVVLASFDIYVVDENWGTGADNVSTTLTAFDDDKTLSLAPDQFSSFTVVAGDSFTVGSTSVPDNHIIIRWATANRLPGAGGTFYIRNFNFSIKS